MVTKQYRKKPVVIEAFRFTIGFSISKLHTFMGDSKWGINPNGTIFIDTPEGTMTANIGDYIIKGVQGEHYPCKPDIFEKTYENVF